MSVILAGCLSVRALKDGSLILRRCRQLSCDTQQFFEQCRRVTSDIHAQVYPGKLIGIQHTWQTRVFQHRKEHLRNILYALLSRWKDAQVWGVRVDQLSRIHRNAQIARRNLTMHILLQTNSQPISLKPAAPMAFSFPLPIPVLVYLSLRALVIQSVSHSFVVLICHFFTYFKGMY